MPVYVPPKKKGSDWKNEESSSSEGDLPDPSNVARLL